jgi:Tfp pilus assembly protein PilF
MFRMNRMSLIAVMAVVMVCGCANNRSEPVGFARQPQLKSDRPARRTKDTDKAPETPRILPETYYAAGRVAEQQGALEQAIEHYRKAIAVNHQYTAAYARLGLMLSVTAQHGKAVEAFEKAVEFKTNSAILRNNLGFELLYVERWDDAERHLRKAVQLDPKLAHAHINLGILLGRTNRYDEALTSFLAVLPEADAHYNLGLLHRAQGRHTDAADSFRHVLRVSPRFTAAKTQLAQVERTPATHPKNSTPPATATETIETVTDGFTATTDAAPSIPTTPVTTEIVDLGSLIREFVPPLTADPTSAPVDPNPNVMTTRIETVTQPTRATMTQTLSTPVEPLTEVVPVTSVTAPRSAVVPTPAPKTALTTLETSLNAHVTPPAPAPPTTRIEEVKVLPTPAAEPTAAVPMEPWGTPAPDSRRRLPLAQAAEAQRNARTTVKVIAPTPVDTVAPADVLEANDEVVLVLGESESIDRTMDEAKAPAAPISLDTQNAMQSIDAMEASLQIIRNEVECRKETQPAAPDEQAANLALMGTATGGAEIKPVASISPLGFGLPVPPLPETSAKAPADPSVAYLKAVPVTTPQPSGGAEVVQGTGDPVPAVYSPPKTTPRRVRSSSRR